MNRILFFLLVGLFLFFVTGCERGPQCNNAAGHRYGRWNDEPGTGDNGFAQRLQRRLCENCGISQSGWH